MTNIKPLQRFAEDELPDFVEHKEIPDEWYVLIGSHVTDYSVWTADEGEDEEYREFQEEMAPEDRDANPPVEGQYQIGTGGWLADAFDFGDNESFVGQVGFGDKIDTRLMNLIVVHESVLSEEALSVANGETEPAKAD